LQQYATQSAFGFPVSLSVQDTSTLRGLKARTDVCHFFTHISVSPFMRDNAYTPLAVK
jgi:hypothetical protein